MIAVTILGNNSALPAHGRHPTAQIVQTRNHTFLVDCGEGTQLQMSEYRIKRSRIDHIFISHLHGDHYFGLIGLLTSFGLNNREHDLHVYSPEGLEPIMLMQLPASHTLLPYRIYFHTLKEEGLLFEDDHLTISCFRVNHKIECYGFLFEEKAHHRKLNAEAVKHFNVPYEFYEGLQEGKDFVTPEGKVIPNVTLTLDPKPGRKYAYCADTIYYEPICKHIEGADLIYHEATYMKDEEERARARYHSTTIDAAHIAKKANVGKLLIGHFSSRYENLTPLENEARQVFANCEAAIEGTCYMV
ncbi:MAG: ribonuclease Z [Chitinophagaceae bacterium]|nr:ribonuclease Z [Chitinophagaceae bacterium]MCW5914480.1 ribonuclease Z [Chitinophagaceae bacterium]MCZ2395418.1 ribonuclease Z [Chitinophagales bacterium]